VTTRNRSQDLTADLLHEIDDAEAAPVLATPPAVDPASADPTPFIETTLFLAPRTWLRPGIARTGTTVAVSAGPVRLRLGRR
jgi:hypothetical protein